MTCLIVAPALAQDEGSYHCVDRIPYEGSKDPIVYLGCYPTLAEAIRVATSGTVSLSDNATIDEVDSALRTLEADQLASRGSSDLLCCTVFAILYDWTNYQSSSITHTTTSPSGCALGNLNNPDYSLNPHPGGGNWDNKIESAIIYANCNYAVMYENINYGGSLNPCASPCSTFGLLNDKGSSASFRTSYP